MTCNWPLVKIDDLKANSKGSVAIGPFGSRMKSDCFKTDQNLEWRVGCFPNGNSTEERGSCMLFLGLESLPKECKSVTIYSYLRCVQTHACIEAIGEYTESDQSRGWTINYSF